VSSEEYRIVKKGDAQYPSGLLDLRDPPPVLYVEGNLPECGIAIVGSRTPPPAAERFAYELARRAGEAIVSGLALGVDAAAHRGALDAGAPTIAYVGYGLGATYPAEHLALERRIVERDGAIATERPPGERVAAWSLVKRDRLQAAHARALILIASEIDGGAMHAVRFARALERPVFAVAPPDGAQGSAPWEGNVRALADGARALPLDNLDEALRIIG
jgi:DNA processing protein